MRTALATALSVALLTGQAGCKKEEPEKPKAPPEAHALSRMAQAAHNFHDVHNRLPRNQEEFEKAMEKMEPEYRVQEHLRSGKYVFVYGGLTMPDIIEGPNGTNGTVLAYEADVPTKGGYVVTCAGEVKKVTAEEFKRMPLAKK
jgi:hypothetical protein